MRASAYEETRVPAYRPRSCRAATTGNRGHFVSNQLVARAYDDKLAPRVQLARRVAIGVDDIPSRWRAQRYAPGAVIVGATSHFEVVVSELRATQVYRREEGEWKVAHRHGDTVTG